MLRRIRRLPSPALVISAIALILAVGGGSFALGALSKPKVQKIANKQITKREPGLSVGDSSKLGGIDAAEYKTASGYTQSSTPITLTSTAATVGTPVQITTQGTKRVFASGAVHATNGTAGTGVYLVCHITVDGTSGATDTDYASPAGGFTIVDASVSPLASAVVPAGTHTVTLLCSAAGGATPTAKVADDALATWAVSK